MRKNTHFMYTFVNREYPLIQSSNPITESTHYVKHTIKNINCLLNRI